MGWGLMRPKRQGRAVLLSPVPDPLAEDAEAAKAAAVDPAASIELIGATAPRALARFNNGYADGVLGRRVFTLPYFISSYLGRSRLVIDPVPGLFGLRLPRAEGFLATDPHREVTGRAWCRGRRGQ